MDFSLLTPQNFVVAVAFLFVCYEAYDKLSKIIARITAEHDRMKKWDEMEDKLLKNIQDERDKIYENYDKQLGEIRQEIETNHTDTEAKLQELVAMVMILTKGQVAALDGLKQQGCNGKVTQAKQELDEFLMSKAVDI